MLAFTQMMFALGGAAAAGILFAGRHPIYAVLCLIVTAFFYRKLENGIGNKD